MIRKPIELLASHGFQRILQKTKSSISTDAVAQYEAFSDHKFVTHLCACLRLTVVTTPSHNKAISWSYVRFSISLLKAIQTKANKCIVWNSSFFGFNAVHLRVYSFENTSVIPSENLKGL